MQGQIGVNLWCIKSLSGNGLFILERPHKKSWLFVPGIKHRQLAPLRLLKYRSQATGVRVSLWLYLTHVRMIISQLVSLSLLVCPKRIHFSLIRGDYIKLKKSVVLVWRRHTNNNFVTWISSSTYFVLKWKTIVVFLM